MRKSTDFTQWLAKDETKEKLKNKTVLMFCTGGIRCERASAYLKKELGDQVEGVYQLQGGIERYLQAFPDGGFWRGKNFVFDKREAVSALDKDGDGGVIRKQKEKEKIKSGNDDDLPAKCCVCSQKWDRYVGKKKCYTCGVPVLMCEKCMSLKPDKTKGMELKVRCPLCVEENITVPASEVEFTENGVKSKKLDDGYDVIDSEKKRKAADSVLKWGGGHAKNKKLQRIAKRRLCHFGKECIRENCIFAHPEREEN
jgi:predicted sulfurtransferase